MGVAVLDNKLYAIGGRDGSSCLSSVEVFDPHTNKWSLAAAMVKRRGGITINTVRVQYKCDNNIDLIFNIFFPKHTQ